ncbi:MAG TPA: hypothetical protein VGD67_26870 [Pseudonocardiaceae bacterium]
MSTPTADRPCPEWHPGDGSEHIACEGAAGHAPLESGAEADGEYEHAAPSKGVWWNGDPHTVPADVLDLGPVGVRELVASLRAQVARLTAERDSLADIRTDLTRSLNLWAERWTALEAERDAARAELHTRDMEVMDLRARYDGARAQHQRAVAELEALRYAIRYVLVALDNVDGDAVRVCKQGLRAAVERPVKEAPADGQGGPSSG